MRLGISGKPRQRSGAEAARACLEDAIHVFVAGVEDRIVSASRVVDPLLEIWEAARQVDRRTAVPVEQLLTMLVARHAISRQELVACLAQVETAQGQGSLRGGVDILTGSLLHR